MPRRSSAAGPAPSASIRNARAKAGLAAIVSRYVSTARRAAASQSGASVGQRAVDRGQQLVHAGVVGGQEALLLVGELLVEGLARHPGPLDDVGHHHPRVSLLGHRLDHRLEHARPLGLADHGAGRGVATAGQDGRDESVSG